MLHPPEAADSTASVSAVLSILPRGGDYRVSRHPGREVLETSRPGHYGGVWCGVCIPSLHTELLFDNTVTLLPCSSVFSEQHPSLYLYVNQSLKRKKNTKRVRGDPGARRHEPWNIKRNISCFTTDVPENMIQRLLQRGTLVLSSKIFVE